MPAGVALYEEELCTKMKLIPRPTESLGKGYWWHGILHELRIDDDFGCGISFVNTSLFLSREMLSERNSSTITIDKRKIMFLGSVLIYIKIDLSFYFTYLNTWI